MKSCLTFLKYHSGKRASELVAAASSLLDGKIASESVTESAARVMDLECRAYRAGLTIAADHDSDVGRKALFKGYDDLERIAREQRIGATFLPPDELRSWFECCRSPCHRLNRRLWRGERLMFDSETADIMRAAPALPGLDPAELPQILTEQYAQLVARRIRRVDED